jgi:hypothetical protein
MTVSATVTVMTGTRFVTMAGHRRGQPRPAWPQMPRAPRTGAA